MRRLLVVAIIAACSLIAGCTSISCQYGPPERGDVLPPDLPIGTTVRTSAPLLGLLDESIDDSSIHYLNIVVPPGYRNRFVKQRIPIPEGTAFQVIGYRRPYNPLCYSHDWGLVLGTNAPFTANRDEVRVKIPIARAHMVVERAKGPGAGF
jgi:hypothetical protein